MVSGGGERQNRAAPGGQPGRSRNRRRLDKGRWKPQVVSQTEAAETKARGREEGGSDKPGGAAGRAGG